MNDIEPTDICLGCGREIVIGFFYCVDCEEAHQVERDNKNEAEATK